ncbi:glyoxylate/hydroxypyruvate reductase A [Acidisphaera sp. L21]|uniref:2-hydroxyacid dehydrogenase n=1 Tax=Acidisphaera sp. L21 TaxID=1641851 RepID=UPI00131DCF7A|nr:glyoxylate/hydroxypyruvate reductase A [Acidisphaera sp. L21]
MLLVKSGGPAVFHEWVDGFAEASSGLEVREWDDPSVRDDNVTYVLVGQPVGDRISRFPKLKAIFSGGAGVDHLTREPTLPPHLPIIRMATHENAQTMGEYVCLAALGLLRDWRRLALAQERRTWDPFLGTRTARTTRVGVLGLGHIGLHALEMLRGLGFQVHGWSRSRKTIMDTTTYAGEGELQPFLAASDIAVGLLPHTPATSGLICQRTIDWMPHGAGLVNAGRGSLVNIPDLVAALDCGRLGGAVLDVFESEPLPADHPAWTHPRITVTSHVAGFATRRTRAAYVVEGMAALERGDSPPHLYLPDRGY